MTPRKFKILICKFSYGGTGGMKSEHPDVGEYLIHATQELKARPDIESVHLADLADTPITMNRNRAVVLARQMGADFLLMIDSDMCPDVELRQDAEAKPFLSTSLDFCLQEYDRGPKVVFAPYCGPPPCENIYVFRWRNWETDCPHDTDARLDAYTREEASERAGIEAVAAGPTGLILYDVRAFALTEPKKPGDTPWFYYEWKDIFHSEKASTEDVTQTRDMAFAGIAQLGYNPIHCNWDAWAGHWKPKVVRKPRVITCDALGEKFKRAVTERLPHNTKSIVLPMDDRVRRLIERSGVQIDRPAETLNGGVTSSQEKEDRQTERGYAITNGERRRQREAEIAEQLKSIQPAMQDVWSRMPVAAANDYMADAYTGKRHEIPKPENQDASPSGDGVKRFFFANGTEIAETTLKNLKWKDKSRKILGDGGIFKRVDGGFEISYPSVEEKPDPSVTRELVLPTVKESRDIWSQIDPEKIPDFVSFKAFDSASMALRRKLVNLTGTGEYEFDQVGNGFRRVGACQKNQKSKSGVTVSEPVASTTGRGN